MVFFPFFHDFFLYLTCGFVPFRMLKGSALLKNWCFGAHHETSNNNRLTSSSSNMYWKFNMVSIEGLKNEFVA